MNDDKISEVLDLAPIEDKDTLPVTYTPPNNETATERQIEADAKYVRDNLYRLIEDGYQAVQEMMNIADQSQHPRSYEVLSNMMRQMVETNKDLLEIHEKKQKLVGKKEEKRVTNNNLFVGSTDALLEMLRDCDEPD